MDRPPSPRRNPRTRRITRVLLALTALGAVVFVGSVGVLAWQFGDLGGDVNEGSFLSVDLSGQLRESPATGFILDPADVPPTVTDIAGAIRAAGSDERIKGLYLDLDGASGGYASFGEIRDAIDDFQAAGKPCVAYSEGYDTRNYWLASTCDEVILAPAGLALVNGMAASITYYAGTLDKLGAQADFEHVGDFKSAIEPLQRTGPSEPASEAMNYLLDGLYDEIVAGIAAGRGVDADKARDWLDHPALSPEAALSQGLVDGLAFRDAVKANVANVKQEGWVASLAEVKTEADHKKAAKHFTALSDYLAELRGKEDDVADRIAIVEAAGDIVSGDADGGLFGGSELLADQTFREWMRDIREDDAVKAVVLRIDSPGGSGLASDMMWREIQLTKAAGKPVVVSMGDYAASGGYYISAPADWIVARPETLTGSIGVFGGKIALGGTWEKLGMTQYTYKRGAEADLLSTSSTFDEGGRAAFRTFLQDFYDRFVGVVAEGRNMDRDAVHAVAQGRVWTGRQAKDRGLVDQIGGLDDAMVKAAELGHLEKYGIDRFPRTKTVFELITEDLSPKKASIELEIPGLDTSALRDLSLLERVLADNGIAAMLPGRIDFQ
jgi:protease-4